ncbi:exonuclease [Xanthomonas phage SB4]|uniref:Exonuclease n=1 Tax=Xanthomonas phage SB4 TaxID=3117473 RepID=A0ABZ2GUQ3_9CAUD
MNLHKTPASFLRAAPKRGAKIATMDIENFPMLSYHWGMFKQFISPIQVVEHTTLMSYCFKWLGQDDVFYADMRGAGKNMRNDLRLLKGLHKILDGVDLHVAQNGERFDLPKIRSRMAIQGLPPLKPTKIIDTLLMNKKHFGFASNSLEFVTNILPGIDKKDAHKNFPGFSLWLQCLADNPEAWDECETYNITDVTTTEQMYLKLRGWYNGQQNVAIFNDHVHEGDHHCDKCDSNDVVKDGLYRTKVGVYQAYRCKSCGGWSRGRVLLRNKAERGHVTIS